MGVDISLHIEIRRQNQWHLMSVSCPFWEQHEHEYKIFDTQVYNVRYYHFRDFLDEACSHIRCNKDILSSELQALIDDEDAKMGYGVFMYNDLLRHCESLEKKFISSISHAGIYAIKEQLDRIEEKLNNGSTKKKRSNKQEEHNEKMSPVEQMYDDFMWDYGCIFSLRDIVRALTTFGYTHISTSDIRLFYLIC
jgi:hypothetical protein